MNLKLQARQRLLSFSPNDINTKNHDGSIMEYVREYGASASTYEAVRGKGEFTLWFHPKNGVVVTTPKSWRPVAVLDIGTRGSVKCVESAAVDRDFIGLGLGQQMYELALKKFGALASSDNLSKGSSALWHKLVDKYHGFYMIPPSLSPNGKTTQVAIVGWTVDKRGITWPIVQTDSGPKPLPDILRYETNRIRKVPSREWNKKPYKERMKERAPMNAVHQGYFLVRTEA